MKKFKKLIPAMVMLLIATMLMGTTTYAWFSMNTTVTATGMKVQAKAEGGLVISATAADGTWTNSASVTINKDVKLLPASTKDGDTWYHAHSNSSSNFASVGYYALASSGSDSEPTGASLGSAGVLVTASDTPFSVGSGAIVYDENSGDTSYTVDSDDGFYLLTKYFIRSSGEAIKVNGTNGTDYYALAVNAVTVATANTSDELDKCLRIGIQLYDETNAKVGKFVVLAPLNGADSITASSGGEFTTTAVSGGSDTAAYVGLATKTSTTYYANANTEFGKTAEDLVPASTSGKYLTANIYVWFEGEDETCKSDNITTVLDQLNISVSFKITNVAGQYNNKATDTEPTT